jgi:hypothetical protein
MSTWFWMNKIFKIGTNQGTLLIWILNSYWFWSWWCDLGCFKGGQFWKISKSLRHKVWERRERGAIGTYNRKPHTLFWYTIDFNCSFGIFFNKTWDFVVILIHVYNNIKKHILLQWILCSYCCVNCLVWEYDEMKCNIVFGVFYNVFWSANSSYMK